MTTDPGPDPKKVEDKCPKCGEPFGAEHKKNCGLWSPYSTSKWVAPDKKEPAAIVVQVHGHWPFPAHWYEQWDPIGDPIGLDIDYTAHR